MSTRIKFTFDGDTQVDRSLARVEFAVKDARPAWEAIAESFRQAELRQFSSQGSYASGGWAPLSPKYASWKAKRYPGAGILVRTGELKRSLTQRPFGVDVIEPGSMAIGSGVPYGKYHQHGTGTMPQRRPVEIPESLRREWVGKLQRYIVTGNVQ